MKGPETIYQLIAELNQDYQYILESEEKNKVMAQRIASNPHADEFDYAALGFTLHNLYNAFEGYFYRVAKFFENNLSEHSWHKNLLERMALSIETVRPALISKDFALKLEELLKFRHLFRNMYKSPLVPEKMEFVQNAAKNLAREFEPRHKVFLDFLRELILQLEN